MSYEEQSRKRVFASEVEGALCAANRGDISQFKLIRRLQKPSGEFRLWTDETVVHRACLYLGYSIAKLDEWRAQYDASLTEPNP